MEVISRPWYDKEDAPPVHTEFKAAAVAQLDEPGETLSSERLCRCAEVAGRSRARGIHQGLPDATQFGDLIRM